MIANVQTSMFSDDALNRCPKIGGVMDPVKSSVIPRNMVSHSRLEYIKHWAWDVADP